MTTMPAWADDRDAPPRHLEPVTGARRVLRAATWIGLLVAACAGLSAAGSRLPSPPAPWSGAAFSDWVATSDPSLAAVEVVRLIALAITGYLGVVTLLALVGRLSGARPLVALADHLALPFLRRTLHYALGAGLAVSLSGTLLPVVSVAPAQAQSAQPAVPVDGTRPPDPPHRATMRVIADPPDQTAPPATSPASTPTSTSPAPTTTAATTTTATPSSARMRLLPDPASASVGRPGSAATTGQLGTAPAQLPREALRTVPPTSPDEPSGATDPAERTDPNRSPKAIEATWTVQPGDHLWHIAGATLTRAWSRPPSDREVAGYLRTLIDVNRDRLAVTDNPDLIFPGQQFVLPPVPAH
jgi:nucleoid-associated protein YgaU